MNGLRPQVCERCGMTYGCYCRHGSNDITDDRKEFRMYVALPTFTVILLLAAFFGYAVARWHRVAVGFCWVSAIMAVAFFFDVFFRKENTLL